MSTGCMDLSKKGDYRYKSEISLQLKWKHQYQFAGYYAASQKGYYEEEGLSVNIKEYAGIDPVEAVLSGTSDFGISNSELIIARAKGKPVVVLAAIYQHSPLVLLSRTDSNIRTVHDLVGKRIGIEEQSAELITLFNKEGITLDQLELRNHPQTVKPLITGEVEAMSAYSTDEPFELQSKKIPYSVISPQIAGLDFYGDCLFTSEDMIEKHPEEVEKFLKASLKGWRYAVGHQDELVNIIFNDYSSRHNKEHLNFEAEQSEKLIASDVVEIGYMNAGRWDYILSNYKEMKLVPSDANVEGFIYQGEPLQQIERQFSWMHAVGIMLLAGGLLFHFWSIKTHIKLKKMSEKVNEDLIELANHNQLLIENASFPVAISELETGLILYVNELWLNTFNKRLEDVINTSASSYYKDLSDRKKMIELIKDKGYVRNFETSLIKNEKETIWVYMSANPIEYKGKSAILVQFNDLTERRTMEMLLQESKEQLQKITDALPMLIMQGDAEGRCLFFNKNIEKWISVPNHSLIGTMIETIIPEDFLKQFRTGYNKALKGEESSFEMVMPAILGNQKEVLLHMMPQIIKKQIQGVYIILQDISEQKEIESKLQSLATVDELTNLLNRRAFYERARNEIDRYKRFKHPFTIFMIDIDYFKKVNDKYGHDIGDVVLKQLSNNLKCQLRATDCIARYGGEEIIVMLIDSMPESAIEIAERMRHTVSEMTFKADGEVFKITISIGLASMEETVEELEVLIKQADIALYSAKTQGRNRVVVFEEQDDMFNNL